MRIPSHLPIAALLAAALLAPPARADEGDLHRKLDALALALERVEGLAASLVGRLDRIDRRLSEIEARVDGALARSGAGDPRGGPSTGPGAPRESGEASAPTLRIVNVRLMNKRVEARADTGDEYLRVDVEGTPQGLTGAARIKGVFQLMDRFDAVKKSYEVTTEPLRPGDRLILKGVSFRLTRSDEVDLWLRTVDARELRGRFEVKEVLPGVDVQDAPSRD
jgi:hypothetical protein